MPMKPRNELQRMAGSADGDPIGIPAHWCRSKLKAGMYVIREDTARVILAALILQRREVEAMLGDVQQKRRAIGYDPTDPGASYLKSMADHYSARVSALSAIIESAASHRWTLNDIASATTEAVSVMRRQAFRRSKYDDRETTLPPCGGSAEGD